MSEYQFTTAQRWAVFSVHGDTCYLCSRPLDFTSMHVDHVIPEHLLGKEDELASVLRALGLPADFDLNSYENWLPTHPACNRTKAGLPFKPAPIVLVEIEKAARKADLARTIEQTTISSRRLGNALGVIEVAASSGELDLEKIIPALEIFLKAHPEAVRAMIEERSSGGNMLSRFGIGLESQNKPILEVRLTPFATIEYYSDRVRLRSIQSK